MAEEDAAVASPNTEVQAPTETESIEAVSSESTAAPEAVETETSEESVETEASDQQGQDEETQADTEATPEKSFKEKMIERRIQERDERRQADALRQAAREYRDNADPEDWEQRVQAIENERFIEKVENNISSAARDFKYAQEDFEVFKKDPELFADVARDAIEMYGNFHPELKDANGDPQFLGFYDPRTGQEIAIYDVYKRESKRLEKVAANERTQATVQAQQNEAKMRASADIPATGGKHQTAAFEDMSTGEQAAYLRSKGHVF